MLTGHNPFGIKCLEDLQKIVVLVFMQVNEEIKLESISEEEAGDFVSGLLRKDRALRTSIEDVASHVFLEKGKGFIW